MGITRKTSNFLVINNTKFPSPSTEMQIVRSVNVDAGRNLNGEVVGQVVGRPLWKISNLKWKGLNASQWDDMLEALEPFFVKVTFTASDNKRHTVTMYPSDVTCQPLFLNGIYYDDFLECSFNLIDCGYMSEDKS